MTTKMSLLTPRAQDRKSFSDGKLSEENVLTDRADRMGNNSILSLDGERHQSCIRPCVELTALINANGAVWLIRR